MKRAIEEPLRQIVANAGGEGSVVVANVKEGKGAYGYNARADKYEYVQGRYHRPDESGPRRWKMQLRSQPCS